MFGLGLDDTAFPFLLFVSQAETEQVLGDHLAGRGVPVERGVEVVGFHADLDVVTSTLRHRDGRTEQVHARYLVGCDGASSTVRRGAGIPFKGGAYPQTFALADLEADGLDRDAAHAFIGQEGIVLFFPLGRPASWRMLTMHPSLQGRREPAQPSLEDVPTQGAWLDTQRERFEELHQQLVAEGWRPAGHGAHWWSASYRRPAIDWDTPPNAYPKERTACPECW